MPLPPSPCPRLRAQLQAAAWSVLAALAATVPEPVAADVEDDDNHVTVAVRPADLARGPPGLPPRGYSPLELAMVQAWTEPLLVKQVAARLGMVPDGKFKIIARNLYDAGVLEKVRGKGYRVRRKG